MVCDGFGGLWWIQWFVVDSVACEGNSGLA